MLNILRHGDLSEGIPLLIVHGLFGSGRNWGAIAKRLSDERPVFAVDQRNHGESPRAASQSYEDMASDLAEVITRLGGKADVLGHSMGGKAAMQLALTRPQMVNRLIVADIAPTAYGHSQSQYIRAMRGLDLTGLNGSRIEADRRLQPLLDDAALRAFFLQSLDLKADPAVWRLNLDVLDAEMDKITGWPGTPGQYSGPALFLTGALSHYVAPEHKAPIQAQFPKARFVKLAGAGHWLHAEKPREFEASIRAWLAATAP